MNSPHDPPPPPPGVRGAPTSRTLYWGLAVGFLPAVMVLVVITILSQGWMDVSSAGTTQSLAMLASLFALGCSLLSSFVLFKRFKTGVALAGAVLLLVINVCVAFFFGCSALLISASHT